MTPPDFEEGEQYPLILEIHGGPHAAYGPYFSAEMQLMAAAGYVVFYDNPSRQYLVRRRLCHAAALQVFES